MNDNTARCVLAHIRDPDRPRPATHGLLCTGHYLDLEQVLSEMPALNADADRSLAPVRDEWRGSARSDTHGPAPTLEEWIGSVPSPRRQQQLSLRPTASPFDENVSDAQRKVRDLLASWAADVTDEHPDKPNPPRFGLNSCSVFLLRWLPWISEQTWVDDFRTEVLDGKHALRNALNPARSRTIALGPCDGTLALSCDLETHEEVTGTCHGIMHAVIRTSDDLLPAEIACTVCGLTKEPGEWRALSRRLRGDEDPMLTFAQLSQLHRIPVGTLKRWAQEDQWRRDDPPRISDPKHYHLDDAQASVDRHATKRQEAS